MVSFLGELILFYCKLKFSKRKLERSDKNSKPKAPGCRIFIKRKVGLLKKKKLAGGCKGKTRNL